MEWTGSKDEQVARFSEACNADSVMIWANEILADLTEIIEATQKVKNDRHESLYEQHVAPEHRDSF